MLLHNSETWTEMSEENYMELENLQNLFFRTILQVPTSTPKPALCWETKTLTMKHRIWMRKLNLFKHLQLMDENTLGRKVFEEQSKRNFPGLVQEFHDIAKQINLLDELKDKEMSKLEFKNCVKKEIDKHNENTLRTEMKKMAKLEERWDEPYERKDYFKNLTVDQIRTKFRLNTRMTEAKFNFKNDHNYRKELWLCDSCEKAIESQSHLLWCPAYANLREGKSLDSDKDLVTYIQGVLAMREKFECDR